MSIFDKKEGGTAVGNALRKIKGIALPVVDVIDDLVLNGKIGDAIDLIKGDTITQSGAKLSPEQIIELTTIAYKDVQHARSTSIKRDSNKQVPLLNKITPVIIDLLVTLTFTGGFYALIYLMFFKPDVDKNTIIQAVLLFGQVQAILMTIVMFYRGGNNNDQHGFINKLFKSKK